MKSIMKSNVRKREHYKLKKAFRNHKRNNDNYSNDTLNEHIESILSCDVIKKSNKRNKK